MEMHDLLDVCHLRLVAHSDHQLSQIARGGGVGRLILDALGEDKQGSGPHLNRPAPLAENRR